VDNANDITIASYQAAAHEYLDRGPTTSLPSYDAFVARFAAMVGPSGHVLELGSGPGLDATKLESFGLRVDRTDATPAFLDMMRADGHEARQLDLRTDELGGPYDAVFANAVLLHLARNTLVDVLVRTRQAVRDGGLIGFTVKEGEGEAWSNEKLDLPRYFVYWREDALREATTRAGWAVLSIDHVQGRVNQWLYVLATQARDS
jgi:predicted TPR repeat methyltransferase